MGQRHDVVADDLGIPYLGVRADTLSVLRSMKSAPNLSSQAQAVTALLICTGWYPKEEAVESLAMALDADDVGLASQLLKKQVSKTPRRVRSRHLVALDKPILDVTRTSMESGQTGIPRVVNLVARQAERDSSAALVVWAAGAPARIHLDPDGRVHYPSEVWGGSRNWFGLSRRLRTIYWRFMSSLSRLPGGFALRGFLRSVVGQFKHLDIGVTNPREIVLIPAAGVLEPEVAIRSAAHRLLPWLEAFPETALTVMVHDLLPMTSPQFFARDQRLEFLDYGRLIGRASRLIVATSHLRNAVRGLCLAQGCRPIPSVEVVAFPSYSHNWTASTEVKVNSPAFYMVGSPEARKNYLVAITAAQVLAESGHRIELNIIGSNRGMDPKLRKAMRRARRSGAYIHLRGAVSDQVVTAIANQSLALLYLSKAEGYGLPIREAQFLGRPVIASSIPSSRELARAGGVYVLQHLTPQTLAQEMLRLIHGQRIAPEFKSTEILSMTPEEYGRKILARVDSPVRESRQVSTEGTEPPGSGL